MFKARLLALILALAPQLASAQNPPNIAAQSVWGRIGVPGDTGPSQAIPFLTLASQLGGSLPSILGLPFVSAKATYGVACDGATNDTAAIAKALAGANGKLLAFPANSTCLTDPQIISGTPVFVGTFTSGSAIVTGLATTTNMAAGQAVSGYTTTQTSAITNTSTTITLNAFWSTANLSAGMSVTGTGIPANTTISSITDVNHVVVNNAATATNATASLTFTNTSIPTTTIKSVDNAGQVTLNAVATGSGTQSISFTFNNVPQAIWAYGTTFKGRATSTGPTFSIENPHNLLNGFAFYGAKFDANSLHGYPLKIHGGQFMYFRDIEALNGATGGMWLAAEFGYGIYSSIFEGVRLRGNAGASWIAKSTNNQGNYLIGGDTFLRIDAQNGGTYGLDTDYASMAIYGSLFQGNGTCGINADHVIQLDLYGDHIEANNGTACAITSTANTLNVKVHGGRLIGSVTAGLLTATSSTFDTSGSDPTVPILRWGGINWLNAPAGSILSNNTNVVGPIIAATQPALVASVAPGTPGAGFDTFWIDSTDKRLHDINDAGTIGTTVVKDTGAANNFLTAISAAGVISKAQPSTAITGTTTNDNAAAGNIGEFGSSTIAQASAVTLSTGATSNLTSVSLAAGDYEVTCGVLFLPGATTNITFLDASVSTTSATLPTLDGLTATQWANSAGVVFGAVSYSIPPAIARFSLSGTTTVFCPVQGTFTVSTLKAYGTLRWRRAR